MVYAGESMGKAMKVCVIIPTYNESSAIGDLVTKVRNSGLECLVIDDGSKDNTAEIARNMGAAVIAHYKNKGKGASLKIGFAYALQNSYDAVVVIDGDGQHDPFDIKRFIDTAKSTGADLVIGNRMTDVRTMPVIRQLTNRWMSDFISKMCGQEIPDTQCGFRLIRSNILQKMRLISSKYETESEILIKAGKNNHKIHSIPIKSIYNGEVSKIHPLKDAYRFARLVFNINKEKDKS